MSKKISLKQFLMKSGKFDRVQDCMEAVRSGNVTINSKIIANPGFFFNPEKSLVKLNNEKAKKAPCLYFLMNKPAGYLSQKAESGETIYGLINKLDIPQEHRKSLFAVGRLDKDTEGLMIITNDGNLSNALMQPGSGIEKKYHAVLENPISKNNIRMLEKGIIIETDDGKYKTKKCRIKAVGDKEIYISVTEGKKRQIRKMFEAIGSKVVYLKRVSIGGLQIGKLNTGEIRQVTREEITGKLEFNPQSRTGTM